MAAFLQEGAICRIPSRLDLGSVLLVDFVENRSSDFTKSGALALPEVVGPIFDEVNEKYGTKIEPTWK